MPILLSLPKPSPNITPPTNITSKPGLSDPNPSSPGSTKFSSTIPSEIQSLSLPPVQTTIREPEPVVAIQTAINHHLMTIRSKAGIFKAKAFLADMVNFEPTTVEQGLASQHWKKAMEEKYGALLSNNT